MRLRNRNGRGQGDHRVARMPRGSNRHSSRIRNPESRLDARLILAMIQSLWKLTSVYTAGTSFKPQQSPQLTIPTWTHDL